MLQRFAPVQRRNEALHALHSRQLVAGDRCSHSGVDRPAAESWVLLMPV
jgi:hypothetical protein